MSNPQQTVEEVLAELREFRKELLQFLISERVLREAIKSLNSMEVARRVAARAQPNIFCKPFGLRYNLFLAQSVAPSGRYVRVGATLQGPLSTYGSYSLPTVMDFVNIPPEYYEFRPDFDETFNAVTSAHVKGMFGLGFPSGVVLEEPSMSGGGYDWYPLVKSAIYSDWVIVVQDGPKVQEGTIQFVLAPVVHEYQAVLTVAGTKYIFYVLISDNVTLVLDTGNVGGYAYIRSEVYRHSDGSPVNAPYHFLVAYAGITAHHANGVHEVDYVGNWRGPELGGLLKIREYTA